MMQKLKQRIRKRNASHVLAVFFLIYIFYTGATTIPSLLISTGNALVEKWQLSSYIRSVDDRYSDMLSLEKAAPAAVNKGSYINLNGLMARLMQQPSMNERVLMRNGLLAATVEAPPLTEEIAFSAENITRLSRAQTESERHFLFVMAPGKVSPLEDTLPVGYTDTTNASADLLLEQLRSNGVECLDLREKLLEEGISWREAFYVTDHHWTPETGFWAYGRVLRKLSDMGAIGAVNTDYTDPEQYRFVTYEDASLGSDGQRTGIYFAGLDDCTFLIPEFDHSISMELPQYGLLREGRYEDVAYYTGYQLDFQDPDYFNYSMYGIYGWGNNPLTHWRNSGAPEDKRCMLIGDSFGNVPFSLMSLYFTGCDELDMRTYDRSFRQHFEEYAPDIVVLMINPDHTTFENADYPYLP